MRIALLVSLQDDDDQALVPRSYVDAALHARTTLTKELGVKLPLTVHIDVERDPFTLVAMTGLSEQTTKPAGSVAAFAACYFEQRRAARYVSA